MLILKLFSVGLESAAVSDAVFFKALDLVTSLLPLASPPPPPASTTVISTAADTSGSSSSDSKRKPPPLPLPLPGKGASAAGAGAGAAAVVLPRSALEDVVNQAAIRATRPTRRPRTQAEEEQIKEAFARVFAKSPAAWANKLSEYGAKHAEKLSKKAPEVVSKPISIKGPKREREETGSGGGVGGEGGGSDAAAAARKRKSRRVDV